MSFEKRGDMKSPLFFGKNAMIRKEIIEQLVTETLANTENFLVNVNISPANRILVQIDNDNGLPISECVKISRHIEANLNRDTEDFELEVSSPGIGNPFKVFRQYIKNKGRMVDVLLTDGRTIKGTLLSANENEIELEPVFNKKKDKEAKENIQLNFNQIKETKLVINFKK